MGNRPSKVKQFYLEKGPREDTDSVTLELTRTPGAQAKEILDQLLRLVGVHEAPATQ